MAEPEDNTLLSGASHEAPEFYQKPLRNMRGLLIYAVVFVLAVAAYINTIPNGFTFDDHPIVENNPRIQQLHDLRPIFLTSYWDSPNTGAEYRPLTLFSYALNYVANQMLFGQRHGSNPHSFHLVNVLLHALCCLAAMWFIIALFKSRALAFFTGLLFALHPIHTEAVASVVGRAEILAALGVFLALGASVKMRMTTGKPAVAWSVVLCVALAFGIFSKENAITALGVFLLQWPLWWSRHEQSAPDAWKRTFIALSLILLVSAAYLLVRAQVLGGVTRSANANVIAENNIAYDAPVAVRVATALRTQGEYLWTLLYPKTLIADYTYNAYPLSHSFAEPAVRHSLIALGLLMILMVVGLSLHSAAGFAAGFYLLTMSVTSNIPFPIGTIKAERLVYLPSFGFCLLAGWLFARLWSWRKHIVWRSLIAILFTALCVAYFVRTWNRNLVWRSDLSLFRETVAAVPNNVKAHLNLATALSESGNDDAALEQNKLALKISPENNFALSNCAIINQRKATALEKNAEEMQRHGNMPAAQSLLKQAATYHQQTREYFERAIRLEPPFPPAYANYGAYLCMRGEYDRGLQLLEKAREIAPSNLDYPRIQLQFMEKLIEEFWLGATGPQREERLQKCVALAREYLSINPNNLPVRSRLGTALFELGDFAAAVQELAPLYAAQGAKTDANTLKVLGGALYHVQQYDKAAEVLSTALKKNPNDQEAATGLALVRKAQGR